MTKYIDADRLRVEIDRIEEEARKVRVSGTDKEAIGADSKVRLCLKLKSFINSLQQEQPSLPSDLDEAKLAFSEERFPDEKMAPLRRAARIGYEAGAEWLAGQGYTTEQCEEYIRKDTLLEWANNALSSRRNMGDDYFIPAIVVLNELIDKLDSM